MLDIEKQIVTTWTIVTMFVMVIKILTSKLLFHTKHFCNAMSTSINFRYYKNAQLSNGLIILCTNFHTE